MANSSETRFASISINGTDKLRLLKFTAAEIRAIKDVIEFTWHKPIQDARIIRGTSTSANVEFKLVGNPWCCAAYSEDSTASRVLLRELIAHLFSVGWVLSLPTGISTRHQDVDTLIFRELPLLPLESEWLAIMFAMSDRLRLIGAPTDLTTGIRAVLKRLALIQNERWESRSKNSYEFTLHGHPWRPEGGECHAATRMLVVTLLETLETFGWSLYTSVKHNFGDNSSDNKKDSWYCIRRVDWEPGKPVFHR